MVNNNLPIPPTLRYLVPGQLESLKVSLEGASNDSMLAQSWFPSPTEEATVSRNCIYTSAAVTIISTAASQCSDSRSPTKTLSLIVSGLSLAVLGMSVAKYYYDLKALR